MVRKVRADFSNSPTCTLQKPEAGAQDGRIGSGRQPERENRGCGDPGHFLLEYVTNFGFSDCLSYGSLLTYHKGVLLSKHDKLIKRFLAHPVDFTWDEVTALLMGFGYTKVKAGNTGGSRVRFDHRTSYPIILHRPHPAPTLKRYQIEQVEEILRRGGLL